jgi:hypothetical protein
MLARSVADCAARTYPDVLEHHTVLGSKLILAAYQPSTAPDEMNGLASLSALGGANAVGGGWGQPRAILIAFRTGFCSNVFRKPSQMAGARV